MRWIAVAVCSIALSLASLCQAASSGTLADKGTVAAGDTAKVKKERVRKETAPPAVRDQREESSVGGDADEGFFSSCLGACIGDFIGSMLGSICGGSADESAPDDLSARPPDVTGEMGDHMIRGRERVSGYTGIIAGGDSVAVWDRPGGEAAGGSVLRYVVSGIETAATQFKYYENDLWVHVRAEEPEAIEGWVRDAEVELVRDAMETAEDESGVIPPGAAPTAKTLERDRPRFQIRGEAFFPVLADEGLSEEYGGESWGFAVGVGAILAKSIAIDARFSYFHGDGLPQYKYVGPTSTDWPLVSDIDVMGIGVHLGQFIRLDRAYLAYGAGPSAFNVKESALIGEYEGETRIGERTDEINEWRFGASVRIEGGFVVAGVVPIGASIDFSWISWDAAEEKSLTLDYLDSSGIYVIGFGIRVGYLFF